MQTSILNELTTEQINYLIYLKLKELNRTVEYYKTAFLPELYNYTGFTQKDHLRMSIEKLDEFKINVQDYRISGHFQYLGLTKHEILNGLRFYAIDEKRKAEDFSENVYIKIPALRNAVKTAQILIKYIPEISIFSLSYICSTGKIRLLYTTSHRPILMGLAK